MSYQDALVYQAAHLNKTVCAVAHTTGNMWLVLAYAIHR